MLRLMYDNVVVAERIKKDGKYFYKLQKGLNPFYIPKELFLGKDTVTALEMIDWVSERIFPPERVGVDKLLKKMGLEDYDLMAIIEKTHACMYEDGFWVMVKETDTYRKDTMRGILGFPEHQTSRYLMS